MELLPQYIPEGYCLSCQGCCRFAQQDTAWAPKLLAEEASRLGAIRILPNPEATNFVCAFLAAESNKCKIYSVRPFECQLYPFLFNRTREKVFLSVDPHCPFVQEARKTPQFQAYVRQLLERIASPSFSNVLKNNRQLIQSYAGVEDLVELAL